VNLVSQQPKLSAEFLGGTDSPSLDLCVSVRLALTVEVTLRLLYNAVNAGLTDVAWSAASLARPKGSHNPGGEPDFA
jgi:hypothetical protein